MPDKKIGAGFVRQNSQARSQLGDKPSSSNLTHRKIQPQKEKYAGFIAKKSVSSSQST
jgi:hypothetical protein